tara:strand:+ start:1964 stop:2440 length:477 start_codon:yes stop_codon:yes gene_type:complete
MSREIKFRVFDLVDNKMYYLATSMISSLHVQINNSHWGLFDGAGMSICGSAQKDGVLMQYTGLKDKNGVEVFQGDFLEVKRDVEGYGHTSYGGIVLVEAHTCGYSLKLISPTEKEVEKTFHEGNDEMCIDSTSLWHIDDAENIEVIGNIYHKPEFIKT